MSVWMYVFAVTPPAAAVVTGVTLNIVWYLKGRKAAVSNPPIDPQWAKLRELASLELDLVDETVVFEPKPAPPMPVAHAKSKAYDGRIVTSHDGLTPAARHMIERERELTIDDIKNMSMDEYRKQRADLIKANHDFMARKNHYAKEFTRYNNLPEATWHCEMCANNYMTYLDHCKCRCHGEV